MPSTSGHWVCVDMSSLGQAALISDSFMEGEWWP